MTDHRRHSRIPVRQRVWCEGDQVTLFVQMWNVSRGGLFVRTASSPPVGDRLRVTWSDRTQGEVVLQTVVVWSRREPSGSQPGMGLRIAGVEGGAAAFERFLSRAEVDLGDALDDAGLGDDAPD